MGCERVAVVVFACPERVQEVVDVVYDDVLVVVREFFEVCILCCFD